MTLQDYSFDAPTIEVLAASPRLEMLQIRLRQAGMRPVPVENGFDPNSAQPLFLDTLTAPREAIAAIAAAWIGQQPRRLLIILGTVPESLRPLSPLSLTDTDQIHALTARIAIRQRDLKRKRELALRAETQRQLGGAAEDMQTGRAHHRALYLGVGTPEFVSLKSALHTQDVELLAALSAYTAKDYLSTGQFGAIILKPEEDGDQGSLFLQEFRASDYDARLALIVLESDQRTGGLQQRLAEKAHMLIGAGERPETVAETLAAYLNVPPARTTPRLTSTVHDLKTGLYSRSFFEAHLQAQMDDADRSGDMLSVIHLRQRGAENRLKQVGEVIAKSLRETDTAAAISRNEICISMPATTYRGAISFVRRMEPILGPSVEWKPIERRRFHTVKSLMTGFALPPQRQVLRKA
ncbi:MAG: diguanylate cyclase [Pseudomonadota bacterium]